MVLWIKKTSDHILTARKKTLIDGVMRDSIDCRRFQFDGSTQLFVQLGRRRGLVDRALGSGDRVHGFKALPWQSGFCAGFLLLLLLSSSSFYSPWFYSVSGVSRVVPLCGSTLMWDQLLAMEKSYKDQLVTARGDLYEKILAVPSVGQNT